MSSDRFIPIASPVLAGNERQYVLDCIDSGWISSKGKYIEQFEAAFARLCGSKRALSCCNGTTSLHLALLALGVGPGDEILMPTLTFVATANSVAYCGAQPVFVDSEPKTWNMDPTLIEARITPRTKGIIVVHWYGHPVEMDAILAIARKHGLWVMEDAAEAHGAQYKGRTVGSMGIMGSFSFFGNKVLTTGEGGMVTTDDEELATKVFQLKEHGMDPKRRYWFPIVGYNYRMTNVTAAIGLAQVEKADWHVERRQQMARWYRERLARVPGIVLQGEESWVRHVYQQFTVVLDESVRVSRDEVLGHMLQEKVEGRPVVFPMHVLPHYIESVKGERFPVADRVSSRGLNLPTSVALTESDVDRVCATLARAIR